jgi:hypothetical protein
MTPTEHKKAKEAALRFQTTMDAEPRTDAEIRLIIKMLREVLLKRQQARASVKYVKAKATASPELAKVLTHLLGESQP